MVPLTYPPAPRGDLPDDPFRPLEDPDHPDTARYVAAQNELTEQVLSRSTQRESIRARITKLWDYPKAGAPFERGGRWFQMRNPGLQAQAVLWTSSSPTDHGRVLIDPNALSDDGTVSLTGLGISREGRLAAYATSTAGSDFLTWRVRQVDSGRDLEDRIEWSKFSSAAWTHEATGFFYGAVAQPASGQELTESVTSPRIMFHRVGTDQADDELVFEAPDHPDWIPVAEVSDDGRYLIVSIQRGTATETRLLVRDLKAGEDWMALVPEFEARAVFVGNVGETFYLMTDLGAERGRVVSMQLGSETGPVDVIPEAADTLVECHLFGGRLVCHYLVDARSALRVHGLDGTFDHAVELPGFVSLVEDPLTGASISGSVDRHEIHYQVMSFAQSGALWSHDLATREDRLLRPSGAALDADSFVTEQVFVESDDGTLVPMFVTHRSDVTPDGDRPVLLYGYGGFNIPITPGFSVTFAAWLDRGGVLAVANLRGGGEYGRAWHDAGRLGQKQNVFVDFASCASWLGGPSGWSCPSRVGIWGGSNGGLLVGACLTQWPDRFGGAVADVGVFDMLRFHLWTIGWAWKSDFGDPDDAEARNWLLGYSPLHHVRPGACYPATLLMTGDHDDRVVPAHSYKFAAALQAAQACEHPILLRVETSAGHGMGKPTSKLIAEATDRLAFLDLVLR